MLVQAFNELLDSIHANQVDQLNLLVSPSENQPFDVTSLQSWQGQSSTVRALAVLPDGSVASGGGSYNATLECWAPWSGERLGTWKGHTQIVRALAVLPDGSVVSGGEDATLRHWDPQSGECLGAWQGPTGTIHALTVLPDGSVVSAEGYIGQHSENYSLRHWDSQSGECLGVWRGHTDAVKALAVLPDGSVVSGSDDKTLRHWDPQSGQCLDVWHGQSGSVNALAVLPDGSVVSGGQDKTLLHWDPQSGKCLGVWKGHTDSVTALVVLPDGSVVSGSDDKTLRHWDPQSGECLHVWMGHAKSVKALAVLPNGDLVSGGDGALKHWPANANGVTLEQLEAVLRALKDNRSVESLALSKATCTPAMMQSLADVIASHATLTSVTLQRFGLTEEAVQPLLIALKSPACKVNQLNVPHNPRLSRKVEVALNRAMASRSAPLPVGSREAKFFLVRDALRKGKGSFKCPAPDWTEAQKKDMKGLLNNTLSHLDWSGAPLTQEQILGLAGALTMNHSLHTLFLEDTQINALGAQCLALALSRHAGIRKLELNENPLGEQGLQTLLEVFQNHSTLSKVNAAEGTQSTKAQRQQLKAYNKYYKSRKEESNLQAPVANKPPSTLPARFYDRAWGGSQVMAEPVFSSALGCVVEKERLERHQDPAVRQQPVVALPLLEEHIRATVTTIQPHAWHEGTVYLPQWWIEGVVEAIRVGKDDVLTAYWERHPGLVTHHYAVTEGSQPVYRLLMAAGRQGAFTDWLEYYSRYCGDDPSLPSIATWFTQMDQGKHALHHLIHTIDAKAQAGWFRSVQFDLGVTGGVYHGLVHLHCAKTLKADKEAIEHLAAQGLLPTEVDEEGCTPLMRAVMEERYGLAEFLLPYSDPAALDKAGNSSLHHLVKAKVSEEREHCIVKFLSLGVDDNCANQAGETPRALLEAREERSGSDSYEALVRAARIHQGRYVERLEKTIILLVEKMEKSSAEDVLKASLWEEVKSGRPYQATTQRLHQLFFTTVPAVGNLEAPEKVENDIALEMHIQ